ncbi:MAG: cytochrome b/b6 domain-containing protein [Paracoccaceae bacterium]|jgi:cytochrome b561|nr:cytochrome b/b6 domain-containing protein [Paracoccaceae bacterium]
MTRYHPLLVAMHWLVAIMIIIAVFIGGPSLTAIDNSDPGKIMPLGGHIVWGLVIGTLMLIRLVTRLRSQKPPAADAGNEMLNKGAKLSHIALYVLVFAMVGSGIGIALSANLFDIVFGSSGATLPVDFSGISARTAHGVIASLITLFVALHVLGWGYHQFIRKDGLFSRMWFGKRS